MKIVYIKNYMATVGLLILLLCTTSLVSTFSRAVIWDLGYCLIMPSKFTIMKELGLKNVVGYMLKDHKNPGRLPHIMFDILDTFGLQEGTELAYLPMNKRPLPRIMCLWLAGTITGHQVLKQSFSKLEQLHRIGYFISNREYLLIKKLLTVTFDPQVLVQHNYPISDTLKLLQEVAKQPNTTLYILSNWDAESFKYLYIAPHMQPIFTLFNRNNIIISGELGDIKPHQSIYHSLRDRYNLNPSTTTVIDDQQENISAARSIGFRTIHIANGNTKEVRKQLKIHGLIS